MNKKIIVIFVAIIIFASLILIKIFDKEEKTRLDMYGNDFTYSFKGESDHFRFDVGRVYFDGENAKILIDDVYLYNGVDTLTMPTLKITINGETRSVNTSDSAEVFLNGDEIKELWFYDSTYCPGEPMCPNSLLMDIDKNNFKENFKIDIEYTYRHGSGSESFDIIYEET